MGAKTTLDRTVAADAQPRARNRGLLTVTSGAEAGRQIAIGEDAITLGRSDEATVVFSDASLSRIHARACRVGQKYFIADAGSTNGTFVNDQRISNASHELKDGDRVQLGANTLLRFSLVDEAEERALKQLYEAARKDGLTGLANRKHLEERLDQEIGFALRHDTELSVIIIDVDHFKKVNDTYGHLAGDAVLKHVATSLQRCVRAEDLVARYGGEEFVIVARGVGLETCALVADRVRQWLASQPVPLEGTSIYITCSGGVASLRCCGDRPDKATLLATADARLYQAKKAGRNRIVSGS